PWSSAHLHRGGEQLLELPPLATRLALHARVAAQAGGLGAAPLDLGRRTCRAAEHLVRVIEEGSEVGVTPRAKALVERLCCPDVTLAVALDPPLRLDISTHGSPSHPAAVLVVLVGEPVATGDDVEVVHFIVE